MTSGEAYCGPQVLFIHQWLTLQKTSASLSCQRQNILCSYARSSVNRQRKESVKAVLARELLQHRDQMPVISPRRLRLAHRSLMDQYRLTGNVIFWILQPPTLTSISGQGAMTRTLLIILRRHLSPVRVFAEKIPIWTQPQRQPELLHPTMPQVNGSSQAVVTRKYLGICVPNSAKEIILRHNDHDALDKMGIKERLLDHQEFAAIDSGSTINLTRESVPLLDFDPANSTTIMGFNGSKTRSAGSGTISGRTYDEHGHSVSLRIPDAHVVKGAPNNLLSVSALLKHKYGFHFTPERVWMVTPQKTIVDLVEKSGLFWLGLNTVIDSGLALPASTSVSDPTPTCSYSFVDERHYFESAGEQISLHTVTGREFCSNSLCHCYLVRGSGQRIDLELAHKRFGHVGQLLLSRMFEAGAIDLQLSSKKLFLCPVCAANKVTKNPVPSRRERPQQVRQPFERIWSDVKGPIMKDFWGNKYFVTFTCDQTRYTVVFVMRRKSEVLSMFNDFNEWVRRQRFVVRLLNSDNGGEYKSNEFVAYCRKHAISQQFTCPDTSAQNGISERLNRTLWEGVNCALSEAALSRAFWSLALKHVCMIKNRIWHDALSDASPHQLVFNQVPSMRGILTFGSDVHVLRDGIVKSRPEPKGDKCIYVGLPADHKGWLVFDPRKRKCRVTYHGIADETLHGRTRALHDYFHTRHKLVDKRGPRGDMARELESLFSDPDNAVPLPMPVGQENSDAQALGDDSGAEQQEAYTDGVSPTTEETGANIGDSDSDSVSLPKRRRRSQEGGRRSSSSVVEQPGPQDSGQDVPARSTFGTLDLAPYQRNFWVKRSRETIRLFISYETPNRTKQNHANDTRNTRQRKHYAKLSYLELHTLISHGITSEASFTLPSLSLHQNSQSLQQRSQMSRIHCHRRQAAIIALSQWLMIFSKLSWHIHQRVQCRQMLFIFSGKFVNVSRDSLTVTVFRLYSQTHKIAKKPWHRLTRCTGWMLRIQS